jgi:hypothetical protein
MLWWWGEGRHELERWRVVEVWDGLCGYSPTQSKSWGLHSDGHDPLAIDDPDMPPLPDLTDLATLGCLLALVRVAWGDPSLHISRGRSGWHPNCAGLGRYATEAEALVAALESAP